jgi:hypothetical protein
LVRFQNGRFLDFYKISWLKFSSKGSFNENEGFVFGVPKQKVYTCFLYSGRAHSQEPPFY